MKHFTKSVLVAVTLHLGICVSATVAAESATTGVDGLLELLLKKGVVTAEESATFAKTGTVNRADLKLIIDLLRTKGTISNEDAAILLQRLPQSAPAPAVPVDQAKEVMSLDTKPVVAAPADQVAPVLPADGVATGGHRTMTVPEQPPVEELKPVLEVLREQGVLGLDEMSQILERTGRKWSPDEEDDQIAAPDQEIEYVRTTLPKEGLFADIFQLQTAKLLTAEEGDRIRKRFLQKLALERVTADINDEAKREIRSQVESRVPNLPEWTRRIRVGGDVRLRYEGTFFDDVNKAFIPKPDNPATSLNTLSDRQRLRVRGRLAFTAKVNDEVEAVIGLATGNTADPVSTNQTLGDSMNKKSFLVDLLSLKWTPTTDLTIWGGRFASPWFSTDLVWDQDINFDGLAVAYKYRLTPRTNLFMTAGAFPLQEIELAQRDKWLFGGQLGLQHTPSDKLTAKLAAAFYDFEHIAGELNDSSKPAGYTDWTAPLFMQKGNTLMFIDPTNSLKTGLAANYKELNVTGSLDLNYWDSVRVVFVGDYVKNLGFNLNEVTARHGVNVQDETTGYQFGITVGHAEVRESGKWKALFFYKYLEADAVVDAFTDSDFHLGGTNAKGWVAGGDYGVGKNVWLSARWLTANEISGEKFGVDVFQFNVNARF